MSVVPGHDEGAPFVVSTWRKARGPRGFPCGAAGARGSGSPLPFPRVIPPVVGAFSANGISAVPLVDSDGPPIGMVSEGDLIGRDDAARQARRDWWLAFLAEGEPLSAEFVSSLLKGAL